MCMCMRVHLVNKYVTNLAGSCFAMVRFFRSSDVLSSVLICRSATVAVASAAVYQTFALRWTWLYNWIAQ